MLPLRARVDRPWRMVAGALVLSLLVQPLASMASQQASVDVTVRVLKRASVTVLNQPASVVVTAADVARGFVDVPAATHLEVKANSDYLLDISSNPGDLVRQVVVTGVGQEVQLTAHGGFVAPPPGRPGKAAFTLGFRILLSANAREGTYPWPLRIALAPL